MRNFLTIIEVQCRKKRYIPWDPGFLCVLDSWGSPEINICISARQTLVKAWRTCDVLIIQYFLIFWCQIVKRSDRQTTWFFDIITLEFALQSEYIRYKFQYLNIVFSKYFGSEISQIHHHQVACWLWNRFWNVIKLMWWWGLSWTTSRGWSLQ